MKLLEGVEARYYAGNGPEQDEEAEVVKFDLVDTMDMPEVDSITYGETIASLRTLAKRFSYYHTPQFISVTGTGTGFQTVLLHPLYPVLPGDDDRFTLEGEGMDRDTLGASISVTNWTYMSWILLAFAGVRGGARYKVVTGTGFGSWFNRSEPVVSRDPDQPISASGPGLYGLSMTLGNFALSNDINSTQRLVSAGGTHLSAYDKNGTLEFEVPYQSNDRFASIPFVQASTNNNWRLAQECTYDVLAADIPSIGDVKDILGNNAPYHVYAAAADDFSPFFFRGAPRTEVRSASPRTSIP